MNSGATSSDFPNMMSLSPGLNNAMDYNQMMQFMSGNMSAGMPNFTPMMGTSDMSLPFETF
jgi:hypothetical protein